MSNHWFQFRQFIVYQDQCGMKVGTDGVILGAWVSLDNTKRVLDIGTGTGLLSLMIAQRSEEAEIRALEIDDAAANQAIVNVRKSKFHNRIHVEKCDFREFYMNTSCTYDLLLCNPPYFINSQKPDQQKRSLARHDDTLTVEALMAGTKSLLDDDGVLAIIVPALLEKMVISNAAEYGLFPCRLLEVHPLPGKPKKRTCIEFSFRKKPMERNALVIEIDGRHQYSQEYINLTKPFYL